MVDFFDWRSKTQQTIEANLAAIFKKDQTQQNCETKLAKAMAYATLGGGKRTRACYVYAFACLAFGTFSNNQKPNSLNLLTDACANALELMHAYSLVHDDLPCMDDDDLRRGKPSTHKAFDEATALLAGDALQTKAFIELSKPMGLSSMPAQILCIDILANAAGLLGMCGGQSFDLVAENQNNLNKNLSIKELEQIHDLKTGALFQAALKMGFISTLNINDFENSEALKNTKDENSENIENIENTLKLKPELQKIIEKIDLLAQTIGRGFQIVDDILDATQDTKTLGKTAGKDEAQNKLTYVKILGIDGANAYAQKLCNTAKTMMLEIIQNLQTLKNLNSNSTLNNTSINTENTFYLNLIDEVFYRIN